MPLPSDFRDTDASGAGEDKPTVDFQDLAGQLPLDNSVGQPFAGEASGRLSPVGSTAAIFGLSSQPSYSPIPTTQQKDFEVAFDTLESLRMGGEVSPWNTAEITGSLQSMSNAPAAAFILSNPQIIDTWQATIWTNTLGGLTTSLSETDEEQAGIGSDQFVNQPMVADFFKVHDKSFSTEEREFVISLLSVMPDAVSILRAADVVPTGSGLWENFKLGWRTITRAPEAIRPVVNDPREQMLSEMHQWLRENPLTTMQNREDFALFFYNRAKRSIEEVEANTSGFFALAEGSVGTAFIVAGDSINDWIHRASDPSSFASRQHLSLGQNTVIGGGMNPSDPDYMQWSGLWDGVYSVVLDPYNIAFGVGTGIRNAGRVPRIVGQAKSAALLDSFRFFGSKTARRVPVFDRGIISRFSYAAFSRTVDEVIELPRMHRLSEKIAKMSSPTAITNMMPDWLESTKMTRLMAETSDPRIVRELMKNGLVSPDMISDVAPILSAHKAATLATAMDSHSINVQKWLDEGGSLRGLADMDEVQDILVRAVPVGATPEGEQVLSQIARRGPGLVNSPVVATLDIKNGGMVVKGKGDTVAGFDEVTGELLGMIEKGNTTNPAIATVPAHQGRGVYSGLANSIEGFDAGKIARENMTPQLLAASALDDAPAVFLRTSELTGDNATKWAVSSIRGTDQKPIALGEIADELSEYLAKAGKTEDAALIQTGAGLSRLSPEGQAAVQRFVQAKGHSFGELGNELIATTAGQKTLLRGRDLADEGAEAFDELRDSYKTVMNAKMDWTDIHTKMDSNLWIIKDTGIQAPTAFRRLRLTMTTDSNAAWMRRLRRSGFRVTHRLPTNISLTEAGEGSRSVRNWVKALGGTDDLANKWADAFLAGNSGTRKDIILEALQEVGDQIDNPMLRDGILTFGNKQGQYTYFYDRAGRELGLGADGSITPMTLSHFSDNFAMPDAKKLLRSMARYGNAKVLPGTRRGILPGTRKTRRMLAENLRTKMQRVHGVDDVPAQDLYAMAYADIIGGEYGRATGMGHVAQAAKVVSGAYGFLHNSFVIAQLAFRPIAWSSRVLLEETFRADLFNLPSVWRNPRTWIADIADATAIRKLPAELAAQGEVADGLIAKMFSGGQFNLGEARKVIPNIESLLDDAGIAIGDSARAQGFVASYVGRELSGLGVTEGSLGLRGNITRRALRRERKLRNTFGRMDTAGLGEEFRWDIGGAEIAQRSIYQPFITEAEAATIPLQYSTTGMTPRGLQTYGRAYGRQAFQQGQDAIVGSYGFNRVIAAATGEGTTYNAEKLVASATWPRVKHVVDRKLSGDALSGMDEIAKADWYLTNVVDEIVETLYGPLANGDLNEKARILRELKNGGSTKITVNSVEHTLNASASNYEGFVETMANVAESSYAEGRQLPHTIAAYLDPRFGQRDTQNIYRRFTDWSMMKFGEEATQKLNRQPAYIHIRERYFKYYSDLGWDADTARHASAEKAAEQVNYIFFDNNNIPQFLKDMNAILPFFSAMWEVGSTWAYKIPSQNVMPVGHLQLFRRVERTLRGIRSTGLVEYDKESNMMTLNLDSEMLNANGPIAARFGQAMFQYIRLPVTLMEHLGGLGNLVTEGEYDTTDLGAWSKDGFSIGIGNPLDPTSHGLMAINQFSLGASPALQLPISMAANAVFAQSDTHIDVEPDTDIAQFLVDNPDLDLGMLLRSNEQAFIDANNEEVFNRALNYDWDFDTLKMPSSLRIPNTSTWESLVNNIVFPFGKLESFGQVITAPSPSAMNYVWRGLLQKYGGEGGDEIAGMLFGQMSGFTMATEVLTQIQMIEAADGSLTKVLELSTEVQRIVNDAELAIAFDESNAPYILDPEGESAVRAQELFDEIGRLNADIMKRASDNAAGSQLMRGIMGQLGPVTPRMWTTEQKQVADYWAAREMALESSVTGSENLADLMVNGSDINTFEDMERLSAMSTAWLNDPTGDEAKVWIAKQLPGLMVYTQGKSFWGPAGPPPVVERFDEWVEQVESGLREPFSPEVFMARYQRAGIGIDREIAIITEYGSDPNAAALGILNDYDAFGEVVDDFDRRYDALEFLDAYLYDGKYDDFRKTDIDDLALFELLTERKRDTRDELETINDLLLRSDLEPDERRRMIGILSSTQRAYDEAIEDLDNLDNSDKFRNPREQVLDTYWALSDGYYTERNEWFDKLGLAQDRTDRSLIFEAIRQLNDQWYNQTNMITGWDGAQLVVPAPEVRSWNAKPQREKQERIMTMIGKRPEWLSQFEIQVLVAESELFADVLPMSTEDRQVYDEVTLRKLQIREAWAADPTIVTKSKRDSMISDLNNQMEEFLAQNGRNSELGYREAVPYERLAKTGLLPDSLSGITPVLNQVLDTLRANDKSPTTNDGYLLMMQLRAWLENTYFVQVPQARGDLMMLGSTMFGETVPSAVYAKLFQGDFYGELG